MGEVKGYKVFLSDWTCRPQGNTKQYTCPGKFEEEGELLHCGQGMHFCKKAVDCFQYYDFNSKNRVAEVRAYGEVMEQGNKCCTNGLEIVREIPWQEVLELVNTGHGNSGYGNSGDRNSGNRNSGDGNSGDRNSGYGNSGDGNSGDRNSGNRNSGNRNSGDWNRTDFAHGCFNTISSKIDLFNQPSDWTFRDWIKSEAYHLMGQINGGLKWISQPNMTESEREAHPEADTTGGYLKKYDSSEENQSWWDGLNERNREIIRSIPNFNPQIFQEITGIQVEK